MENRDPHYSSYEIDLREFVREMLNQKWIIIGVTLGFMLTNWLLSGFLMPLVVSPRYKSSAIVEISPPVLMVDNALRTSLLETPSIEILVAIATEEALSGLVEAAQEETPIKFDARQHNGDYIRLEVEAKEPVQTVDLANRWAEQYSSLLNNKYDLEILISQLEEQTEKAQKNLLAAQSSLREARSEHQISLLEVELEQTKSLLSHNLTRLDEITALIEAAQELDAQLATQNQKNLLTFRQALTLTALNHRLAGDTLTGQCFFTSPDYLLENYTVARARQDLDDLITDLQNRKSEIEEQINVLEEDILLLSNDLNTAENDLFFYQREQDLALEAYSNLRAELESSRLYYKQDQTFAQVFGQAKEATRQQYGGGVKSITFAGMVGFMLSSFYVFITLWLRDPVETHEE